LLIDQLIQTSLSDLLVVIQSYSGKYSWFIISPQLQTFQFFSSGRSFSCILICLGKNEYLPLEIFIAFRPMGHYRRTFRVEKKTWKSIKISGKIPRSHLFLPFDQIDWKNTLPAQYSSVILCPVLKRCFEKCSCNSFLVLLLFNLRRLL